MEKRDFGHVLRSSDTAIISTVFLQNQIGENAYVQVHLVYRRRNDLDPISFKKEFGVVY